MGYLDLTSLFVYKKPLFRSQLDGLAENDLWLKDNGWQDSTKVVFYQAAAPSGWTKLTTHNDKFLRVVSGAGGGSGGSQAPSATVTLNHSAHSVSSSGNHTHTLQSHEHAFTGSGVAVQGGGSIFMVVDSNLLRTTQDAAGSTTRDITQNSWDEDDTPTTGSGGDHSHTINDSKLTNMTFSYVDILVCEKDTSSGYTDKTEEFGHDDKIDIDSFPALAANDLFLKDRLTPSGSVSFFFNASAPSGWTKLTTQNDKALRVVSGTGGGATTGSQGFGDTVAVAHNHAISSAGGHTHSVPNHSHTIRTTSRTGMKDTLNDWVTETPTASGRMAAWPRAGAVPGTLMEPTTQSDGGGTSNNPGDHSHTVGSSPSDFVFAYCDVIQCSKDSGGEPFPYADLSATIFFKKLVSKQKLRAFAQNDSYNKFHTVPAATVMYFWQAAAPIHWTKSTSHDDKALRVVSGSGGGSAGTQGIGSTLAIAHTHSLSSEGHTHSYSHTHAHSVQAVGDTSIGGVTFHVQPSGPTRIQITAPGTGHEALAPALSTVNASTDNTAHDHGGATGSALTNINFAYIDVIACTKDAD